MGEGGSQWPWCWGQGSVEGGADWLCREGAVGTCVGAGAVCQQAVRGVVQQLQVGQVSLQQRHHLHRERSGQPRRLVLR